MGQFGVTDSLAVVSSALGCIVSSVSSTIFSSSAAMFFSVAVTESRTVLRPIVSSVAVTPHMSTASTASISPSYHSYFYCNFFSS